MKAFFRKILFGDIPVREYSTITVNDIREKVFLLAGKARIDISSRHWLLCLQPVVFAVWVTDAEEINAVEQSEACKIHFNDNDRTVAIVQLSVTGSIKEKEGILYLLTLQKSRISHIGFIKTWLLFNRYYKKPNQPFDKLKAFASAYSYPRKVRIVSFRSADHFNIFPMDLVGDIAGSNRFVFGLRHTNVTLAHLISTKKVVISEVPFTYKDIIYKLGKHHSQPLSANSLPFATIHSRSFGFPVPVWANSYKEISIIKTIDLGSHMLLWGEVIAEEKLTESAGHLFHIHFLHYLHQKNKGHEYPLV